MKETVLRGIEKRAHGQPARRSGHGLLRPERCLDQQTARLRHHTRGLLAISHLGPCYLVMVVFMMLNCVQLHLLSRVPMPRNTKMLSTKDFCRSSPVRKGNDAK
jgi:hypothetical protein